MCEQVSPTYLHVCIRTEHCQRGWFSHYFPINTEVAFLQVFRLSAAANVSISIWSKNLSKAVATGHFLNCRNRHPFYLDCALDQHFTASNFLILYSFHQDINFSKEKPESMLLAFLAKNFPHQQIMASFGRVDPQGDPKGVSQSRTCLKSQGHVVAGDHLLQLASVVLKMLLPTAWNHKDYR